MPILLAGYQKGQVGKMNGFLFFRHYIFYSGGTCSSLSSSQIVKYLLWMQLTPIQLYILLFQRKEFILFSSDTLSSEAPIALLLSEWSHLLTRLVLPRTSRVVAICWSCEAARRLCQRHYSPVLFHYSWCVWAQVPDLLLRIQGAQAHFVCLSPDSSCWGLLQGQALITLQWKLKFRIH